MPFGTTTLESLLPTASIPMHTNQAFTAGGDGKGLVMWPAGVWQIGLSSAESLTKENNRYKQLTIQVLLDRYSKPRGAIGGIEVGGHYSLWWGLWSLLLAHLFRIWEV